MKVACLLLALASSGCSWIRITHCTVWNLLPALSIPYDPPVCAGGQPTQYTKPRP